MIPNSEESKYGIEKKQKKEKRDRVFFFLTKKKSEGPEQEKITTVVHKISSIKK